MFNPAKWYPQGKIYIHVSYYWCSYFGLDSCCFIELFVKEGLKYLSAREFFCPTSDCAKHTYFRGRGEEIVLFISCSLLALCYFYLTYFYCVLIIWVLSERETTWVAHGVQWLKQNHDIRYTLCNNQVNALALWLVNQLWVIVPVNPWKNHASCELLYESNRPQVSMGYITIIPWAQVGYEVIK